MTQEQDKRRVLSPQDAFFNAQFNANPVEVFPGQCMISKQEDDFPIFKAQDQSQIKSAMEPFDQCFHALEPKYTGKSRIQIRLSGCAGLSDDERDCGTKTLVIVKEYLARKGIRVMGQDIGGEHIRRIHVMPTSGHIVKRLLRRDSDVVYLKNLEAEYQNKFQSFLKSTAL
jgi:hypothetical protein